MSDHVPDLRVDIDAAITPPPFTDSFNRANSTTTLAAPWANVQGTWGITGNVAYPPALSNGRAQAVVDVGTPDGRLSVTSYGGSFREIVGRYVDVDNYLLVQQGLNSSHLYQRIGGVFTSLQEIIRPATAVDRLELSCVGRRCDVYVNDVAIIRLELSTATHAVLGAATRWGISATSTADRHDDVAFVPVPVGGPWVAPTRWRRVDTYAGVWALATRHIGPSDRLDKLGGSEAVITLDDAAGALDTGNPASPLAGLLTPDRQLRALNVTELFDDAVRLLTGWTARTDTGLDVSQRQMSRTAAGVGTIGIDSPAQPCTSGQRILAGAVVTPVSPALNVSGRLELAWYAGATLLSTSFGPYAVGEMLDVDAIAPTTATGVRLGIRLDGVATTAAYTVSAPSVARVIPVWHGTVDAWVGRLSVGIGPSEVTLVVPDRLTRLARARSYATALEAEWASPNLRPELPIPTHAWYFREAGGDSGYADSIGRAPALARYPPERAPAGLPPYAPEGGLVGTPGELVDGQFGGGPASLDAINLNGDWTMAALLRTNGRLYGVEGRAGGVRVAIVENVTGGPYYARAGVRTVSNGLIEVVWQVDQADGRPHLVIARKIGTTLALLVDGVFRGSASIPSAVKPADGGIHYVGIADTKDRGQVGMVATWNTGVVTANLLTLWQYLMRPWEGDAPAVRMARYIDSAARGIFWTSTGPARTLLPASLEGSPVDLMSALVTDTNMRVWADHGGVIRAQSAPRATTTTVGPGGLAYRSIGPGPPTPAPTAVRWANTEDIEVEVGQPFEGDTVSHTDSQLRNAADMRAAATEVLAAPPVGTYAGQVTIGLDKPGATRDACLAMMPHEVHTVVVDTPYAGQQSRGQEVYRVDHDATPARWDTTVYYRPPVA